MGFDNECIINIQSLAGEYFCPVCRTLVYPNEALQSQCTHLYCKPCLTYVVGTTKACPYDGYLVTEADSKPLIESNKALAETIGKIPVHCLFHRSGCTWQGPLSECTSHCSGCAFGNSPVVCNRCMIQIVHRQVQEHAQNCPGANPQVQQATGSSKDAASSGAAASANSSQTSTQPGTQTLQAQVSQTAAVPPAQDHNQQANANAQVQAVASAAVLTTEQWYQQQYQQYYQQYPGYDPYQQSYQHYYPYQQLSTQHLQQHPPHIQGQQQPQVYPQPNTQLQPQHQPHSQQPLLPQAQAQAQAQVQTQLQPQLHSQQQPPSQHQPQNPPQGQPQSLPFVQNQVNPQQQANPGLQPHPQPQSQTQQPAHGHMPPQQQPYPQVQLHPQGQSVQPQLQQHLQAPQYQQSHPQGHQVQLQIQHSQPQLQHPVQQTQPQNHPQLHPPHPNQPQSQQLASHAVAGHHMYPPVLAHQQMQPGAPQQHPMHMHPPSGSLPQVQVHAHFPQPPLQMRPPQAHASLPFQQQPNVLQSQGQVPSVPPAQQNQIRPHPQQQVHVVHQRPVLQTMQQPLQPYGQQPPFPGQVSGLVQGQLPQQVPFVQQPMQSQSRPQGPPQSLQPSSLPLPPPPHSGVLAQGMPPHQSQAYVGRPVASNHAAVAQPFPQPPGTFGVAAQLRPMQLGSGQPSGHQIYVSRTTNQQLSSEQQFTQSHTFAEGSVAERETGSHSQNPGGKDASGVGVDSIGVKDLKSETGEKFADKEHKITSEGENNGAQDETPDKGADAEADAVKVGIRKIVKEEGSNGNLDPSSGGKSVDIATLDGKDGAAADTKLVENSSVDASSLRQSEAFVGQKKDAMNVSAQEKNLSQGQVAPQGSAVDDFGGFQGKGFMHSSQLGAPSDQGRHQLHPMPYGPLSQQQRPIASSILPSGPLPGPPSNALVSGQGPIQLRPHAPGHLPPPRKSLNPPEHLQQPGSFQDIPFGGAPTPGLRGTGQFGLQPSALQGQYNQSNLPPSQAGFPRTSQGEPAGGLALGAGPPGSFDPQGGVMGRAPPYGPEGRHPFNPVKTEMFRNQRPHHFDGRHPDFHGSGPLERGQFAQHSGNNESNLPTMNGVPGPDSTSASGLADERFKAVNEENWNPFQSGPTRRLDQGEFEEVPKQFHAKPSNMGTEASPKFGSSFSSSRAIDLPPHEYNYDAGLKMDRGGGAPSRFLPPYHTAGAFHPNDAGERRPQTGLHEDSGGRGDFARTQPDFLGSGPGFGRHQIDRPTTRSTGGFGGLPGGPLSQSALDEIDGRDTHPFGEGSRSLNLSSDPVGNSFRDGRFPVLPAQVRRGEFDGPGNFGMSEHFRNGDMVGQDFIPNHSSRGEFLGPRNGPMRVGDDFGAFSVSRIGELPGAGGFPVGEPFGGNKLNHPRLGEPGFRSSYSLHGFPADGGFYAGNSDSFDRLRKRMPASTGWCRICKVDCETVEGLDLHSQTREHQKMTMDMVISIKQQNAKRQKTSKGHSSVEEGSRSRNAGNRGRGNKP